MNEQLIFGIHTPDDAKELWKKANPQSPNPCVRVYGPGPKEKTCKDCKHLYAKKHSNTYYKCDLRKNTNGPGTDHRKFWPSCAKFEEGR